MRKEAINVYHNREGEESSLVNRQRKKNEKLITTGRQKNKDWLMGHESTSAKEEDSNVEKRLESDLENKSVAYQAELNQLMSWVETN